MLHHLPLELLETETVNRLLGELWPLDRHLFPPTAPGPAPASAGSERIAPCNGESG